MEKIFKKNNKKKIMIIVALVLVALIITFFCLYNFNYSFKQTVNNMITLKSNTNENVPMINIDQNNMNAIIAYDEYKNAESYYFSLFTAVFSFAFGIIFPSMVVKATRRNQNIQNKSNSTLSGDSEMLFKFDEERMFIFVNRGEKFRSAIDTDYDYIFKVYEDNETYILYISKMECYIINKSDLISGTLEEFNKIISSHVPADKIERKIQ